MDINLFQNQTVIMKIILGFSIAILITIINIVVYKIRSRVHFLPPNEQKSKGIVVVLHGITKSNRIMYKVSKSVANGGYEVYNFSYPSTKHNIDELIDIVYKKIKENGLGKKKINIVAHSMGGLVTRGLINRYKLNVKRVVQIGTPNHGSEVANFVGNWWFYRKIYGPAGQDLRTTSSIYRSILKGGINYELGIIAGNRSQSFITSLMIPGEDDGLVSVKSTKLKGMKEHIVLRVKHEHSLFRKQVADMVLRFLNTGSFESMSDVNCFE